MKKITIGLTTILIIVSMLFLGIACNQEAAEEVVPADKETVIVVGASEDFTSLNVLTENAGHLQYYFELIYDGLMDYTKDGEIVPSLAESWEVSEDLTEYTFNLRKGVKWHNGREFVAGDVKETIEWASNPESGCFYGGAYNIITGIEIIDDYTIKLIVNEPNAAFLNNLVGGNRPILPMEQFNEDGSVSEPIGSGPYRFVEWVPDDHFTVEKNPDYWGGDVNVDKFIFKPIEDVTVKSSALKTGEIDVADTLNLDDVVAYAENPEEGYTMDVSSSAIFEVLGLVFAVEREPFNNEKVRVAIAYAIDKEAISNALTKGLGIPAKTFYPTGFWSNQDGAFQYSYDPEKAKQLLEEAGYPDGFDTSINVLGPNKKMTESAVLIQQYLKDVGINAVVDAQELGLWLDSEANADFDMHIAASIILPDPDSIYSILLQTGAVYPGWFGKFTDPKIDELLAEGRIETDMNKRKAIYDEVETILSEKAGCVWIDTEMQSFGYVDGIEGVEYSTTAKIIYDNNQGWPQITKK